MKKLMVEFDSPVTAKRIFEFLTEQSYDVTRFSKYLVIEVPEDDVTAIAGYFYDVGASLVIDEASKWL